MRRGFVGLTHQSMAVLEMCDENDLKSAVQEISFSTMSVHLVTLLCLSLTFCLRIK